MPATSQKTKALLIAFIAITSLFSGIAHATDIQAVWLGGAGNWDDPTKWSTNPVFPNNNGSMLYAASNLTGSIALQQNITVDQLTLNVPGFEMPGLALTLNANTLAANSQFNWSNGNITGPGNLTSLGSTSISGSDILNGANLDLSGNSTWSTLLNVIGPAVINNQLGAVMNLSDGAGAQLNVPGSESGNQQAFEFTFNNLGTINVSTSTQSAVWNGDLDNSGTINVKSGALALGGNITSSGSMNVSSGATLTLDYAAAYQSDIFTATSSITGSGTVDFDFETTFAGTYNVTGTTRIDWLVTFTGPIQNLGNTVDVNGTLDLEEPTTNPTAINFLKFEAGKISNPGIITSNNTVDWLGGSFAGPGVVNANAGLFLNGLDAQEFNTVNTTLNCYGRSYVQVAGFEYYAVLDFNPNAAFTIMPGATFNGSQLMIQGYNDTTSLSGTLTNLGELDVINIAPPAPPYSGMQVLGTIIENKGIIRVTNNLFSTWNINGVAGLNQDGGIIVLNNGTLAGIYNSGVNINSGSLTGYGHIEGPLYNNGIFTPSGGPTTIYTVTLGPQSVLSFLIAGGQVNPTFGKIVNDSLTPGNIQLGGTLQITLANGFQSQVNSSDVFTLISGSSPLAGEFTNVATGQRLETTDGSGSFLVNYSGSNLIISNFKPSRSQTTPIAPTIISGPIPASGSTTLPYSYTFQAIGYPAPKYSLTSGAAPAGLKLSPEGVITGTPAKPGIYSGIITASNGVGAPATEQFTITISDIFSGNPAGNNLSYSAWFGYYDPSNYPAVDQYNLGYEYVYSAGDGVGGVYLHDYTSGHFWYTSPSTFPYLYDYTLKSKLYYYGNNAKGAPRRFYDFSTKKVISE